MVEYDGAGRIVCFFIVIAAIGVVSIPSGLIASGFAEIVQSKSKAQRGEQVGNIGDGEYLCTIINLSLHYYECF